MLAAYVITGVSMVGTDGLQCLGRAFSLSVLGSEGGGWWQGTEQTVTLPSGGLNWGN